ncbi:MAG: GAF domain-containing protein [Gammaproteobacteria bacterium]|nr:GAF domain-containing protein [Gammaproteobacteria bacterium]
MFVLVIALFGIAGSLLGYLLHDRPLQDRAPLLILFIGIIFSLVVVLWQQLNKNLLRPLEALRRWADDLHQGKLSSRLPTTGSPSFNALATDINHLSDKLQSLTEDMQSQVHEQTHRIAQKTLSLEIIYDVAASINVSRDLEDLLTRFLHTLKEVVDARAAVVRLVTDNNQMRLVASTGLDEEVIQREQFIPADTCLCGTAYNKGVVLYEHDVGRCNKIIGYDFFKGKDSIGMIAVPLQYRDRTLGVYNLFVDNDTLIESDELNELLTSIGRHLGMAIEKSRLDDEANRLSIMEERTRIAHELHDSLAQTLASLRFQVRVLDENLRTGDEPAVWHELEKIEINLDEAYAELRELITHFRAPIDKRGLVPAVQQLVNRFRNQTGIATFLQQEWNIVQLPASIEVEVLRIIQESLNNIRKHSQAQNVRVILRSTPQGECDILLEDDGIGMDINADPDTHRDHYGLHIMAERAKRINAELRIESEPGEGTQINLTFRYSPTTQPISTNQSTHSVPVLIPTRQVKL